MFLGAQRALILGAHTDDEMGCAGTIARMIEEGTRVHYACFSSCEESVPKGFDEDVLKREVAEAIAVLGIEPERFTLFSFPVRHFPAHRQEILEELIKLRKRIEPDLVFVPAFADIHQDHGIIAHEGLRAFKQATLLGYELPMNTMTFQHACFVQLESRHMERKIAHLQCYRSQQHRPYVRPNFIRALATVRGVQINAEAAEAFEVIRLCVR
jgi:LmbE family N-acetylglucosaminyl deacetylase